jgi:hypothetical protein
MTKRFLTHFVVAGDDWYTLFNSSQSRGHQPSFRPQYMLVAYKSLLGWSLITVGDERIFSRVCISKKNVFL